MGLINLICLPFEGGNKHSYNSFKPYFEGRLKLIAPELPGRGMKISKAPMIDAYTLADTLLEELKPHLKPPYAIYGHGMGGLLGYLLVWKIRQEGLDGPVHFFCSGRGGPAVSPKNKYHLLPKKELIEVLKNLGGSPSEILGNKEIMDIFLPIIRADFKLVETFQYQSKGKLDIPITIMIGDKDELVSRADAEAWQSETSKKIQIVDFPGQHHFIFDKAETVCRTILNSLISSSGPIS